MKRVYVVWILLAFVILICILGLWTTYDSTATMTQQIETIAQKIENGDLSEARALGPGSCDKLGDSVTVLCVHLWGMNGWKSSTENWLLFRLHWPMGKNPKPPFSALN